MKRAVRIIAVAVGLACVLMTFGGVHAQDMGAQRLEKSGYSVNVAYGQANDDIDIYRLGIKKNWCRSLYDTGFGYLSGYFEASVNSWDHDDDSVTAIGLSPVFAFYFGSPDQAVLPYVEAGIGAALISQTMIGGRDMASKFQFEDRVGIGLKYERFDICFRYMHYSNAGISEPNDGIDILMFSAGFDF
ncbi:MAG: acyloxyacyl hydrolase [Desulfobacteraceae bacterium]|nr:MAG: acyloxyacyl hydrolase [Desulfobacteraceae bacterium]